MNIQTPDGKVVAFPDSMSQQDITAVLDKQYSPVAPTNVPKENMPDGKTPEWAGRHPNLYGMVGAGKALARTGIEAGATTIGAAGGALVPIPGASLVGAGVGYAGGKRAANYLFDEPVDTSVSGIAGDVAIGGISQGVGSLIGKIPGVKRILSPERASIGPERTIGADALNKVAETMVEKSLKVAPSIKTGPRGTAVETLLTEKIPISKGGLAKTRNILDDINLQMDEAIASSPKAQNMIPVKDVLGPINELRDKMLNTVNGTKLAKKIDGIINSFTKQHGPEITVADAQVLKQNTNMMLRKAYGEIKDVETESVKQLVRGLKDRIAAEIPEITGLNLRYSQLKTLEPILERAVNRTGNWDFIGLLPTIAGASVGGATGSAIKAAEAGMLLKVLKNPQVQSRLAIMLRSMGSGSKANFMANTVAETAYNKIVNGQ
jgi:hypothetical protein